jgi:hypothetical protein
MDAGNCAAVAWACPKPPDRVAASDLFQEDNVRDSDAVRPFITEELSPNSIQGMSVLP